MTWASRNVSVADFVPTHARAVASTGIARTIAHACAIARTCAIPNIARTIAYARTISGAAPTIAPIASIRVTSAGKISILPAELLACARFTVG